MDNVKIPEPLGNSVCNINVKSESKNKNNIQEKLPQKATITLDLNNMLRNKTAIECWNILKYEIESIMDKFVTIKKQGKQYRNKHLSKEAIRKIVFKQTM